MFSIVIPAFNAEGTLRCCLDSVARLHQPAQEVLVVDDGSTDDTLEVAETFAREHAGVTVIRAEHAGEGPARQLGLDAAQADYVLFVDADDEVDPSLTQSCAAALSADLHDVVWFRFTNRTRAGSEVEEGFPPSLGDSGVVDGRVLRGDGTERLLGARTYPCWQAAYRREFLRDRNIRFGNMFAFAATEFTVAAIVAADSIALVDQPLYVYRHHETSSKRARGDHFQRLRENSRIESERHLADVLVRFGASPVGVGLVAGREFQGLAARAAKLPEDLARERVCGFVRFCAAVGLQASCVDDRRLSRLLSSEPYTAGDVPAAARELQSDLRPTEPRVRTPMPPPGQDHEKAEPKAVAVSRKKALWITLGVRGNAGDALLYEVTKTLFEDRVDLVFQPISRPIDLASEMPENTLIGPGGVFVGTNSARNLHRFVLDNPVFDTLANGRIFAWSCGILETPSQTEAVTLARVLPDFDQIIVRAQREIDEIRRIAPSLDPAFVPCATLFADQIMNVAKSKSDVVVLNMNASLFTAENFKDHPMRRFRDFARAAGLDVRLMVNVPGTDVNERMLELFPLIDQDESLLPVLTGHYDKDGQAAKAFNSALQQHARPFAQRYNNCRFAFGKRLHAWLPFLAFNNPSAFIGMAARRRMPQDYFGNDDFLCPIPLRNPASPRNLDELADLMIAKLDYFIRNEALLNGLIAERRMELYEYCRAAAATLVEMMA